MEKPTLLCVDDEVDNVEALERLFRSQYKVLKATSGSEALNKLRSSPEPIAVILTDQRMPEMSGVDFLHESLATHPEASRILLTGYTDIESIVAAVNSGQIYRYINKPWDPVDLMATVAGAAERYRLQQDLKVTNSKLKTALDELKTLDQAKTQFMVLINHELKTPLTSMINFLELLRETKLDEEQKICVERIEKSSMRLKELIHDSLIVISAETKTLNLKITPFELSKLDLKLNADVEKRQAQRKIDLKINFGEQKIIGDASALSQVVRRLIHNAIKFANEGSIVQVESKIMAPHRLQITIANDGPQISDSVRERILQPFFLNEDMMKHTTGVGLGLTVCQALLKAQASSLQISNLETGVLVSFELAYL